MKRGRNLRREKENEEKKPWNNRSRVFKAGFIFSKPEIYSVYIYIYTYTPSGASRVRVTPRYAALPVPRDRRRTGSNDAVATFI